MRRISDAGFSPGFQIAFYLIQYQFSFLLRVSQRPRSRQMC